MPQVVTGRCDQCRKEAAALTKRVATKALSGYGETVRTAEVARWLCDDCLRAEEAKEQAQRVMDYRPGGEPPEDIPPGPWPTDAFMCGIVSMCGPNGEPLACAYPPNHDGDHSWATLPTFVATERSRSGSVIARATVDSLRRDDAALRELAALLAPALTDLIDGGQLRSTARYGDEQARLTLQAPSPPERVRFGVRDA